jgi:hypothetical protein
MAINLYEHYVTMLNEFEEQFEDKSDRRAIWAMLYCNVLEAAETEGDANKVTHIVERMTLNHVIPEILLNLEEQQTEIVYLPNLIENLTNQGISLLEIKPLLIQKFKIKEIIRRVFEG